MTRLLALLGVIAVSVPSLVWAAGHFDSAPAEARVAPHAAGEPAFLTLLNFAGDSRAVQVERLDEAGAVVSSETTIVAGDEVETLVLEAGSEPVVFRASCEGCVTTRVGLAGGQRAIVFIAGAGDPITQRSDIRIVNESGVRQAGALRTGLTVGGGRRVIGFDLLDGEGESVGVRLRPGQLIGLNLTCDGCAAQFVRVGNGVDLELPLRQAAP